MALRGTARKRKPSARDITQAVPGLTAPKRDGTRTRNLNYNRGRAYEYALKKVFESYGYIVTRAAGSHGHADLIAGKGATTWAIQVKARKPIKKEIEDIRAASKLWHANHLMAWKEPRGPWRYQAYVKGDDFQIQMSDILPPKDRR